VDLDLKKGKEEEARQSLEFEELGAKLKLKLEESTPKGNGDKIFID